jgi:hypothetical protein
MAVPVRSRRLCLSATVERTYAIHFRPRSAIETYDLMARRHLNVIIREPTTPTVEDRSLAIGVDAERVHTRAIASADAGNVFIAVQGEDIVVPTLSSVLRKRMSGTVRAFVNNLDRVNPALPTDLYFNDLGTRGDRIVCEFVSSPASIRVTLLNFRHRHLLWNVPVDYTQATLNRSGCKLAIEP